jgi:hypothetical protein
VAVSPERTHFLADGRKLRATFDADSEYWTVHLDDDRGTRSAQSRVISDAASTLLEPDWPALRASGSWYWQAVEDLAARRTPLGWRFACPCCGYLTLEQPPGDTFRICEVCFWEDDGGQLRDPDEEGGANKVSLRQGRSNFREHGACEPRCIQYVRPPEPGEIP